MSKQRWAWSLALPALVLLAAAILQAVHFRHSHAKARTQNLASSIPAEISGWTVRDVPLGATEFLSGEVEKVLNYDDVVNREYVRGGDVFGVYVAYWSAGKMPTQVVASHTPDRCWTENGWRCVDMKFKHLEELDGVNLQPAEWRLFEPPAGGQPTYVLYWCLVGGRAYDYGARFNEIPSPMLWWKSAVQQLILGSREQYFIRVTSSVPMESLWNDPGFAEVMRSVAGLGLVEKAKATGQE